MFAFKIAAGQRVGRNSLARIALAILVTGGLGLILASCSTPSTSSHVDAELKKHGV